MGFFDKIKKGFISETDKINQSHLQKFVFLAMAGGNISEEDYQFMEKIGKDLNLSKSLIYEVFNQADKIKNYKVSSCYDLAEYFIQYIEFANRKENISSKVKKTLEMILLSQAYINNDRTSNVLDSLIDIVLREQESYQLPKKIRMEQILRNELLNKLL